MDGSLGFSREPPVDPSHEQEQRTVDMSAAFLAALQGGEEASFRFNDELRAVRRTPELTITVNWRDLTTDPPRTQGLMRWMKGIVESGRGQRRSLTIRGTRTEHEQAARIEANVLASGVHWEYTTD